MRTTRPTSRNTISRRTTPVLRSARRLPPELPRCVQMTAASRHRSHRISAAPAPGTGVRRRRTSRVPGILCARSYIVGGRRSAIYVLRRRRLHHRWGTGVNQRRVHGGFQRSEIGRVRAKHSNTTLTGFLFEVLCCNAPECSQAPVPSWRCELPRQIAIGRDGQGALRNSLAG